MPVTVINKYHPHGLGCIDIMRPGPFGNPFMVKPHGPYERGEAVEAFREWFHSNDPEAARMRLRVKSQIKPDDTIKCCCKPKACHGDVIAEYVNAGYKKP